MRRMKLLLFSIILLCLSTPAHAQLWSGIIDPSRAVDWSQAGIPGGIPNRTTICATLNPGATYTQINTAIAACPSGQVVFLNAGTYNLSGGITFSGHSNVTLRGAGPDKTMLVFTAGNGCNGMSADICIMGSSSVWEGNVPAGNIHNWTAGYAKSTTQITLDSTSGISVGMVLILDQLDDATDTGGIYVCDTINVCSEEGGAPGRSGRHQQQFVKVTAISGTQVTISPGLYMPNWRSSQQPQAWFWGDISQTASMDGVEDLAMDHTNSNIYSGIEIDNAYLNWVKNVKSLNSNRNHIWLYQSTRTEVRDSYFYGTKNAASQSYGVEAFMTSDNLVINNIYQHVTSPVMIGPSAGSVFAYNYSIDMYSYNTNWIMAGFVGGHDAGSGTNLFEGNTSDAFMMDLYHGTGNMPTLFRNQYLGTEPGKTQGNNTIPMNIWGFNRLVNLVGNVLGTAGFHTTYEDSQTASGTPGNVNGSIYVLGYTGVQETTPLGYDSRTVSTLLRWGNFDYATNQTHWNSAEIPAGNAVPATHTLPSSLFLSSKPNWWGIMPWPAIGPDVTGGQDPAGHAYKIPARVCYDNTSKDSNGILIFNANICYNDPVAPDTTPPTVSMTAPANGATVAGTITVSASATDNVGVVGVQFKLDGVNLGVEVTSAPYAVSWTTTAASNGQHTLTAVARDAAGNTATSAAVSVTVDNASPVISSMSASGITSSSATISWTTDEASDSQVEYGTSTAYGSVTALNASLVTAHSQALSGLSASTLYHYRVKSRDAAGNLATSADVTFTTAPLPDTTPPTVSITAPAAGATVAGTVTVSASATDNVGVVGVQFKLDGVNLGAELTTVPYTLAWITSTAANGAHSVTAVARDAAGNTAPASAVSVTVDNAPPLLSSVASTSISSSAATITWATDEASDSQVEYGTTSAYVQVSVLASALVSSHSVGLSGLSASTVYHYRVKSRDAVGNLTTSADFTFTTAPLPDTTPPAVSMTAPANGTTVAGTVTVSASATDNVGVVGVQFRLDGVNLGVEVTSAPYAVSWTTTAASNGQHTLTAVARDAAGNTATSAAVSVTVDNASPVISSMSASGITSSSATISWTTDEASDSQVEYGTSTAYGSVTALNASLVTAHSQALSGLSASTLYHYRVKSRDAAGNLATSADVTFTTAPLPDTTPPTVSITAPAAGATVAGTVTVSASATDNVGVVGVQFKLDGVNLG